MIDSDPVSKASFQKTYAEIMSRQNDAPSGRRLYELLYKSLPEDVGKAFIPVEGHLINTMAESRTMEVLAR